MWHWLLTLNFSKSNVKVTILIYIFLIRRHRFSVHRHQKCLRCILPKYHIKCITSCLTLKLKVKVTILAYFFWIVYMTYTTRDIILNYIMFDLECQGQRSQYWYIFFWIPWHQFSGNRHKNYFSIAIERYWILSRGPKWPLLVLLGRTVL